MQGKTMQRRIKITAAVAVIVIPLLVIAVIVLAVKLTEANRENVENTAVLATVTKPRELIFAKSTDTVTIEDEYLGEISIAALDGVPVHTYNYENLMYESRRYAYVIDGETVSKTGIDVSYHNGEIDWEAVAADGIDFAMLRIGYRGYETGELKIDPLFEQNIQEAQANGIEIGVYFFTQAVDEAEALEEAEYVIQALLPYEITYPVVLDIEIQSAEDVRGNEVTGETLNRVAEIFCNRIREEGFTPMIYANKRMAYLKLDMRRMANYDFWFAEYSDEIKPPSFYYNFQMWQYATDGKVNGVDGDVDLNLCFFGY
jgi:GH25 family lysozyme M1 (1,4-beta-N-acetylmuramidase)